MTTKRKPVRVKAWAVVDIDGIAVDFPHPRLILFTSRRSAQVYKHNHYDIKRVIRVMITESK